METLRSGSLDDLEIHVLVAVNEHVAEAGHVGEALREVWADEPALTQDTKDVTIGLRLAPALVGQDVKGDVERRLNGKLQCVLHEALFAPIGTNVGDPGTAQVGETHPDEGELLLDQGAISHAKTARL